MVVGLASGGSRGDILPRLVMHSVELYFCLAAPAEAVTVEQIHALFPELEWGREEDLMRHSDEWPLGVVLITEREGYLPGQRCDYPIGINFVHFPGRVRGNYGPMLAVRLALLRRLAAAFECRVLCEADEYANADQEQTPDTEPYAWTESFVCQGGRIYSGVVPFYDVMDGVKPGDGWVALDDIPEFSLSSDGTLVDEEEDGERMMEWIATRDASHLHYASSPIYPEETHVGSRGDDGGETTRSEEEEAMIRQDYERRLNAWNRGGGTTASKQLIADGISLPHPDSLDNEELSEKLWEVIHGLAKHNHYLNWTDHLNDRELYSWLWTQGLNEKIMDLSGLSEVCFYTAPIGGEDGHLMLTYFNNAEERANRKADYPLQSIPRHQEPPYDRDRLLPGQMINEER